MSASALFDLTGRVALVSGAASGMGRAMAIALAEAGADLMLAGRNIAGLEKTAGEIRKTRTPRRGGDMRRLPAGTDPPHVRAARPRLWADRFSGQCRRRSRAGARRRKSRWKRWSRPGAILSLAASAAARKRAAECWRRARGSIVNIGSIASVTAMGRGHIAYVMAMGAVAQMTRELSTEWSGRGVRVNAILPAQVINPSLERRMTDDPALRDTISQRPSARTAGRAR